jgi:hypothetical protein
MHQINKRRHGVGSVTLRERRYVRGYTVRGFPPCGRQFFCPTSCTYSTRLYFVLFGSKLGISCLLVLFPLFRQLNPSDVSGPFVPDAAGMRWSDGCSVSHHVSFSGLTI